MNAYVWMPMYFWEQVYELGNELVKKNNEKYVDLSND